MEYLYKIVCCVEFVESRPPFLWVHCQCPEIALRARSFPRWYFAFLCCRQLGERRVTSHHSSLWPLWPPTCYHPFISSPALSSVQTWEKNREREKRKWSLGQAFSWGQLPAASSISRASPNTFSNCWPPQKILSYSLPSSDFQHGLYHSFCFIYMQWILFSPHLCSLYS